MRNLLIVVALLTIVSSFKPKEGNSTRFNHVALYVSNMDESIEFYTKAFGLKVTNRITELERDQPDGSIQKSEISLAFLKFPDQDFIYELAERPEMSSPEETPLFAHMGIDVIDIEAAYDNALKHGAKSLVPVRSVRAHNLEVKQAFLAGLDGEVIELIQVISGEF